jgi:hypothetical protein
MLVCCSSFLQFHMERIHLCWEDERSSVHRSTRRASRDLAREHGWGSKPKRPFFFGRFYESYLYMFCFRVFFFSCLGCLFMFELCWVGWNPNCISWNVSVHITVILYIYICTICYINVWLNYSCVSISCCLYPHAKTMVNSTGWCSRGAWPSISFWRRIFFLFLAKLIGLV